MLRSRFPQGIQRRWTILSLLGLILFVSLFASAGLIQGQETRAVKRPLLSRGDDITVPVMNRAMQLDGACEVESEYAGAQAVTVDSYSAYLLHTGADLWVCLPEMAIGRGVSSSWATLYVDANFGRLDPAQPDDLALELYDDGTKVALAGGGRTGSYSPTSAADGLWDGVYVICCDPSPTHTAEFRLDAELLGGLDHALGAAIGVFGEGAVSERSLWPGSSSETRPSTWAQATPADNGTLRTFSGAINYQSGRGTQSGVAGVGVSLIGVAESGREVLVTTAFTDENGDYVLTSRSEYPDFRLEIDPRSLPRGMRAITAGYTGSGQLLDERTILFDDVFGTVLADNDFLLSDVSAGFGARQGTIGYLTRGPEGPYYLIIAPTEVLHSGALDEFVLFKSRQGFTVETISFNEVYNLYSAPDTVRQKMIRLLEQDRYAQYGERFQYMMLVGEQEDAPYPKLGINSKYASVPYAGECFDDFDSSKYGREFSDWYYVDLVSEFDSPKNGCFADMIWTEGYDGPEMLFEVNVSVGRIPFSDPETVRDVLANSIAFEQQSDPYKRQALLALSMNTLEGYFQKSTSDDDFPCTKMWWPYCVAPSAIYQSDQAVLGAAMSQKFLEPSDIVPIHLYQNVVPAAGGSGIFSDKTLSSGTVKNVIENEQPGFVNFGGHGNSQGIYTTYWEDDYNNNGQYDAGKYNVTYGIKTVGPEYASDPFVDTTTFLNLEAAVPQGAVYFNQACSTLSPTAEDTGNLGQAILSSGHGVAVFGSTGVTNINSWSKESDNGGNASTNYFTTRAVLQENKSLGEALWQTQSELLSQGWQRDSFIAHGLYGDPSLGYWGNVSGHITGAPWAMARQNPYGQGWQYLPGPGVPQLLWEHKTFNKPTPADFPTSPVLGHFGEVIVPNGRFLDVMVNGEVQYQLELDAKVYGTPAIAADNTVYALDTAGHLYAFEHINFLFGLTKASFHIRRWKLATGSAPLTSPIVGSDGHIYLARVNGENSRAVIVRPDGYLWTDSLPITGHVVGVPAVHSDRTVYFTTDKGQLVRFNLFVDPPILTFPPEKIEPAFTTPPMLAWDGVYAGREDGIFLKHDFEGHWVKSFVADTAVTMGPVIGPDQQVLIGTESGQMYSLTRDLDLRWERTVGEPIVSLPAFSADAFYVVIEGQLRAYHPHTGASLWMIDIDGLPSGGSVAVGDDREIYLYDSLGGLYTFGEGWTDEPLAVTAEPIGTAGEPAMNVRWVLLASPMTGRQVDNRIGVLLQRSVDGDVWEDVAVLPLETTEYTDSGLLENTSYLYRVQVLEADGADSEYKTLSQPVVSLPAVPQPPTITSVTPLSSTALELTWEAAVDDIVSGYRLERATSAAGPFETVQVIDGSSNGYVDEALAAGQKYYYRLTAENGSGVSAPSAVVSGQTHSMTLTPPERFFATRTADGMVVLTWAGGDTGLPAVIEYQASTSFDHLPLDTVAAGTNSYTFLLTDPDTHSFRLKFVDGDTESPFVETSLPYWGTDGELTFVYLPLVNR